MVGLLEYDSEAKPFLRTGGEYDSEAKPFLRTGGEYDSEAKPFLRTSGEGALYLSRNGLGECGVVHA